MTRILVWPADRQGCGHYRLIFPALSLAGQGGDVWIDDTGPKVLWDTEWSGDPPVEAHVMGLAEPPHADVVVLQRPGRAHWAETIPHLQSAGVKVVVDIDDDFAAISRRNVAWPNYDPTRSPRHNHRWISRACQLADLVTVSTPALASRYGAHGRVRVLPNLVPAHYLDISVDKLPNTVGWSGSIETHPGDLQVVGTAVSRLLKDNPDWAAHVIGTGKGVPERLKVPQVSATGKWLTFTAYPLELAKLSVGLVPLEQSRFNTAKSALKLAELSALGVPTVASPTPDNQRLSNMGAGLLASSPSQFYAQLSRLVRDEGFRTEITERSRQTMRSQTYELWAELWADAWESTTSCRVAA